MRTSQRGITFIGFIILAVFIGLFVYAGIRLVPLYLEYMNIAKDMDSLKQEMSAVESPTAIRAALDKRLFIDAVTVVTAKDVEIKRDGPAWIMTLDYDAPAPFIANVSFSVHFEKTVVLGNQGGP
jgi:hypothetical protein